MDKEIDRGMSAFIFVWKHIPSISRTLIDMWKLATGMEFPTKAAALSLIFLTFRCLWMSNNSIENTSNQNRDSKKQLISNLLFGESHQIKNEIIQGLSVQRTNRKHTDTHLHLTANGSAYSAHTRGSIRTMRYIRRNHKFSRQSKKLFTKLHSRSPRKTEFMFEQQQLVVARKQIMANGGGDAMDFEMHFVIGKWWRWWWWWCVSCVSTPATTTTKNNIFTISFCFLCGHQDDDGGHCHWNGWEIITTWKWYHLPSVIWVCPLCPCTASASAMTDDEWKYALHMLTQWSEGKGRRKLKDGLAQFWK